MDIACHSTHYTRASATKIWRNFFNDILCFHSVALFKAIYNQNLNNARMSCIFCDIVSKKTDTEILFENDDFVAFRDIKPAAAFHFLIIPKHHILNTNALTVNDKPMCKFLNICMLKVCIGQMAKRSFWLLGSVAWNSKESFYSSEQHEKIHARADGEEQSNRR